MKIGSGKSKTGKTGKKMSKIIAIATCIENAVIILIEVAKLIFNI